MSDAIFVFVGQCGITVGAAFYEQVLRKCGKLGAFASASGGAAPRCVLVDTESKVIDEVCGAAPDGLEFRASASVTEAAASTTPCHRFAAGYHGRARRPPAAARTAAAAANQPREATLVERALEAIRREAERSWMLGSFVVVHSLGGGAGSGISARLVQHLRALHPKKFIASVAVAPFATGQGALTHYNTVLCTDAPQCFADVVFLYENDKVLEASQQRLRGDAKAGRTATPPPGARVGLEALNETIGSSMAGVFVPVAGDGGHNQASQNIDLWELSASVCPAPDWKFVELYHVSSAVAASSDAKKKGAGAAKGPHATGTARGAQGGALASTKKLMEAVPRYSSANVLARTLSAQFIYRGFKASEHEHLLPAAAKVLQPVPWNPFNVDFRYDATRYTTTQWSSASLVTNRSTSAAPLDHALGNARAMYDSRAFWHWYTQDGCEDADLLAAFESVQDVVSAYKDLET